MGELLRRYWHPVAGAAEFSQENSIDPVHFEWLHDNWSRVLRGEDGSRAPAHQRLGFDEFDYGFVSRS
jgi:hypothetical protein